jgi:hypothetical protein
MPCWKSFAWQRSKFCMHQASPAPTRIVSVWPACTNSCTIFSHFSLHQYSTSDGSELVCRLYPSLIFSHFYIKVGQCVWRCQMSLAGLTGFRRQTPYHALACSILPAPFSLLSSFTWLQINCSIFRGTNATEGSETTHLPPQSIHP